MKIILLIAIHLAAVTANAQFTGIGTYKPQEKLHVAGDVRINEDLKVFDTALMKLKVKVGHEAGDASTMLRVSGGITRTQMLTAGGSGFTDKMLSVYGDAMISGASNMNALQVTGDGFVDNNWHSMGRVGINGATNGSYGLIVNNAKTYLGGFTLVQDNARINGSLGVGAAADASYGLKVSNANSYLQGNATITNDAVINGNARIDGRIGINGATNANYGMIVNNAATYLQGNVTVSGNLNVVGDFDSQGSGTVLSNGASSIRLSFSSLYVPQNALAYQHTSTTFNLPEFGPNVNDVRVSVSQYVDHKIDDVLYDPADWNWYVTDVNPDNNTAKLVVRNLTGQERALRGDFYFLIMIRE